jgi:hypothetical protein
MSHDATRAEYSCSFTSLQAVPSETGLSSHACFPRAGEIFDSKYIKKNIDCVNSSLNDFLHFG